MSLLRYSVAILMAAGAGGGALAWQAQQHRDKLEDRAMMLTGGSVSRGRMLFTAYGCNACHSLSGAIQAASRVGPSLDGVGTRAVIAGRLSNRPNNLAAWIAEPQRISPGTAMPNLGVTDPEARDIAAYLYAQAP